MPVVFRHKGCRFFFFSNEGDPLEPIHIHVQCDDRLAKFWVSPSVDLAESYGFSASELNKLSKLIARKTKLITERWHDHFDQ
jgi:Domain of unknown function (DUF4160)